jgi:hypothetical protein
MGKGRIGELNGTEDTLQSLRDIHREMERLAEGSESVLDHALYHAKSSRGKVLDYIALVGKCMVRCLTMYDKVQFSRNDVH